MQRCRAKLRNSKFIISRKDLLTHFSPHTPMWTIGVSSIPPTGKEFDLFAQKLENTWSGITIEMKTIVNTLLAEVFNLDDPKTLGWKLDLRQVASCTAKDYGGKGCLMGIDLKKAFTSLPSDLKMLMGVKQCFSTALSVPFPAEGLAVQGDFAMTASPVKPCVKVGDCQQGFVCQDLQSQAIKESGFDFFDLLFRGATGEENSINVLSDHDSPGEPPTRSAEIANRTAAIARGGKSVTPAESRDRASSPCPNGEATGCHDCNCEGGFGCGDHSGLRKCYEECSDDEEERDSKCVKRGTDGDQAMMKGAPVAPTAESEPNATTFSCSSDMIKLDAHGEVKCYTCPAGMTRVIKEHGQPAECRAAEDEWGIVTCPEACMHERLGVQLRLLRRGHSELEGAQVFERRRRDRLGRSKCHDNGCEWVKRVPLESGYPGTSHVRV